MTHDTTERQDNPDCGMVQTVRDAAFGERF